MDAAEVVAWVFGTGALLLLSYLVVRLCMED